MSDILILTRFAYLPWGTYGKLTLPDGREFFTVERPWLNNAPFESCIYEGSFFLGLRQYGVVTSSSGGEFTEGWEVMDVNRRTYIMIHPANWPCDLEGCIGVGMDLNISKDRAGNWVEGVTDSRAAFRELMEYLGTRNEWALHITHRVIGYMDA